MAFNIKKRDSYRWTVEHVLSLKDGKPDEVMKIDVEFKWLDADAAQKAGALASTDPETFFEQVVVGWHDAPEGWEFSKEKFIEFCTLHPGFASNVARAYFASVLGAVTKN